jgi:hypothetical protein
VPVAVGGGADPRLGKGTQVLRVFLKYSELASWTINPLWNGQEAPDYSGSRMSPEDQEKEDYPLGPFRADFYLHTNVQRAKARGACLYPRCTTTTTTTATHSHRDVYGGSFLATHRKSSLSCPRS